MAKVTYDKLVTDKLESLEVQESFSVKEFLIDYWGQADYFTRRSFDVYLSKAKKKFKFKEFKTIDKRIVRVK